MLACVVAMAVFHCRTMKFEFSSRPHFIVFTLSITILSIGLCLFTRGPS